MNEIELVVPPDRKPIRVARTHSTQRDNVRGKHSDHFQTPACAILPLLPFIGSDREVWDPCDGKGNIILAFIRHGYDAWGSDIQRGQDFLQNMGVSTRAVIVTNPPYSIKDAFIEHCYALGAPFALLMPLTALEGQRRQKSYREHGLQLMVLPRRIDFETPNLGSNVGGAWFSTAWFTWKLNLPSDLYFAPPPAVDKQ